MGFFFYPPDRTVCGPPPLEANLSTFCKGSLIYKRYVWVLPIPYPLSPPYCLFTIPYYPLPPLLPIAYSLFPILCSPFPPLLPIPFPLLPPSTLIAYSLFPIHPLLLSFMGALFKRGIQKHICICVYIYIYVQFGSMYI